MLYSICLFTAIVRNTISGQSAHILHCVAITSACLHTRKLSTNTDRKDVHAPACAYQLLPS